MNNFGENLNNNNIFNYRERYFQNKPAILVAAGPSLQPELENLRRIKEEGSAYIFSVGSAIKLLVNNDIHPHVWSSMEPQAINIAVFQDIIDKKIDTIPLLYGTSVGHNTVIQYPGPKTFMMMDKDTITPYYLPTNSRSTVMMVNDAPTIAITTLQAMILLGFNPIILVGQNLAFLNNRYYAEGINYAWDDMINVENFKQEMVENVDGEQVSTQHAWVHSRKIMEMFIRTAPNVSIINASAKGAKIEGAPFKPLDTIMSEYLNSRVVDEEWYKTTGSSFDPKYLKKQDERMSAACTQLGPLFENAVKIIERLKAIAQYNRPKQIDFEIEAFQKCFGEIVGNIFYQRCVNPMLMIGNGKLQSGLVKIRTEKNASLRAKYITEEFGRFINEAKRNYKYYSVRLYKHMQDKITEFLEKCDNDREDKPC